jgi:hypothetical protein
MYNFFLNKTVNYTIAIVILFKLTGVNFINIDYIDINKLLIHYKFTIE